MRFSGHVTIRIDQKNWTIIAIRKHIGPNKSLPGTGIAIRIDKSSICRVIVSALQIVESRLIIIIVPAIPQRIDLSQSTGT